MLAIVERYILYHDLRATSENYYRSLVSVVSAWHGSPVVGPAFEPELVSRFLKAKQEAGCSAYYLRSLRNGLRALLRFTGQEGPIRQVKLPPLVNTIWSIADLIRLLDAIRQAPMTESRRAFFAEVVEVGYYTGLALADIQRLCSCHVDADGRIIIERSKTGKRVVAWLPPYLAGLLRASLGPRWKLATSGEHFRHTFCRLVRQTGLVGSFKTLRKSSGTAVELLYPGRGHEHLANTRKVFETFYLNGDALPLCPLRPPMLPE